MRTRFLVDLEVNWPQLSAKKLFEYLDVSNSQGWFGIYAPVGFNRILEAAILPNENKIYEVAISLLKY